jgi:hypothetical protein
MPIKPKDRRDIENFKAYLKQHGDARDITFLARFDAEMHVLEEALRKIRHGISLKTEWVDPTTYRCELSQHIRRGGEPHKLLSLTFNRVAAGHLRLDAEGVSQKKDWSEDHHLASKKDCHRLHETLAEMLWQAIPVRDQLALNQLITRPGEEDDEDPKAVHTDWKEELPEDHVRAGEISRNEARCLGYRL